MTKHPLALVAALAFSAQVFAQYPSRGSPDPAWNGGQPLVVDLGVNASGADVAAAMTSLSLTRHAAALVRFNATNDAILIIDTAPEKLTTFVLTPPSGTGVDQVHSLAPAGSALLIGGARTRANGRIDATIELREIGVDPNPVFESRGELVVQSTTVDAVRFATFAIAADPRRSAPLPVWQARDVTLPNDGCGPTTVHRLDHAASAFTERYAVNLTVALAAACVVVNTITLDARLPGDAAGTQALLASGSCRDTVSTRWTACVFRLIDNDVSLSIDHTYGTNGVARLAAALQGDLLSFGHAADVAGNLFLALTQSVPGSGTTAQLRRLRANGTEDSAFGFIDVSSAPTRTIANGVAIAGDGTVQLVGSHAAGQAASTPMLFYYHPASGASQFVNLPFPMAGANYSDSEYKAIVPLPAGGAFALGTGFVGANAAKPVVARFAGDRPLVTLIEYFNAGFGHYFVTALDNEIRFLDSGVFVGWRRTGESFPAFFSGTPGASDVCRFFSATFAPKSSHFYTPFQAECDGLKAGTTWTFEGNVFALNVPSGTGACPPGTRALHRFYNNGQSGAPNHRYVSRDPLRVVQGQQGWTEEGLGSPAVFACVPA